MSVKYSLVHLTDIYCPPPRFIRAAAAAGFDCVSLRTIPMGLKGEIPFDMTDKKMFADTKAACEETGVVFNDTENARIVDGVDVSQYEPHLAAAAELGVRHILTNIWTKDKSFYTDQYGKLCELGAQYGQDVNVEFVTWASVTNLKETAELLYAVNAPNCGIVLDTLHFYRSRCTVEELAALPPEWFRYMHLCDAEKEIPTDEAALIHTGREERLYPGEGAIDMRSIVKALPDTILRGIELPHLERVKEIGIEEHARRALKATKEYLTGI